MVLVLQEFTISQSSGENTHIQHERVAKYQGAQRQEEISSDWEDLGTP